MHASPQGFNAGTVDSYSDRGGYGYIRPDDESESDKQLLVHRKSLRDPSLVLRPGDRVVFRITSVPRGQLAVDVHLEDAQSGLEEVDEAAYGTIERTIYDRGFGFLKTADGRNVFFHVSHVDDSTTLPPAGTPVVFRLVATSRGLEARDIEVDSAATPDTSQTTEPASSREIAALASLAREDRRYDAAAKLYQQGLAKCPSVQLILSYAAMEKNRNRHDKAMEIYEDGIRTFPKVAKLREDAGTLAATKKRYDIAIARLQEALKLCRTTDQAGEKGVLLALARTYYRMDTIPSLKEAVRYYTEALKLFGRGRQPPAADFFALKLSQLRTRHHRGNLVVAFFRSMGFDIVRADLLGAGHLGGDVIIRTTSGELLESYGLGEHLLVRCLFKTDVSHEDIEALDSHAGALGDSGLIDDQVTFLAVSSLPNSLQRLCFNRIDNHQNAIIPLPQSSMEDSDDALSAFRAILDRWLYRRDLFSATFPVEGRKFFGRDKPLAELRNAIDNSFPAGVFGLRKVGKTSLLKETARRSTEAGDVVIYVDLLRVPADVDDTRWLYWRISDQLREGAAHLNLKRMKWRLGGQFEDYLDIPPDLPVATAFDADLTRLLREIHLSKVTPRPKVVFLLDEVERLLPTRLGKPGFRGFFDFFGYLRGVAQENRNFVIIITGANAAISEASQFEERDNPVFNFFNEVYLQLLEQNECALMMRTLGRGMGVQFTAQALDRVFELTGGHPSFARRLGSFLARTYAERPVRISAEMIGDALGHYLERSGKDFEEIMDRLSRDYPHEKELCIRLALEGGEVTLKSLRGERDSISASLRHLEGYQIVNIRDGKIRLTMDLLRLWLFEKYGRG